MQFPTDFYAYLNDHTLVGIIGGTGRLNFLDIWMVEVDGRVFARSWNRSKRSWFTALLDEGEGQIRYGEKTIKIRGQRIHTDPELTGRINQAYLAKYNQPENIPYAQGITQPEHVEYTMEFLYEA